MGGGGGWPQRVNGFEPGGCGLDIRKVCGSGGGCAAMKDGGGGNGGIGPGGGPKKLINIAAFGADG